jgi:hypothetical protein
MQLPLRNAGRIEDELPSVGSTARLVVDYTNLSKIGELEEGYPLPVVDFHPNARLLKANGQEPYFL